MSEHYDEQEVLRAKELAGMLEGETPPEVDEQAAELAEFAGDLPWQGVQPAPRFREKLRQELSGRRVGRGRPRFSVNWARAGAVAAVVVVFVVTLYIFTGPRIGEIFGSVYNSLDGYRGQPAPAATQLVVQTQQVVMRATVLHTAPPAASPLPAPTEGVHVPGEPVQPVVLDRKIIKNAEMDILVESTGTAIDRITGIAVQYGGYIINSQAWYDDGYMEATITLGVPQEYFEQVLRRLRDMALKVNREAASGIDVTDQYTDLQSQLRNLEATEARLRSFLEVARTVKEALEVNTELAKVLEQIEIIKGKLNYIEGRSAFSTIVVDVRQLRPTPTPTPTPTPVAWRPGETVERAGATLTSVGRFLVELFIWIGMVVVPILGIPALLIWVIAWGVRRRSR